MFHGTSSRNQDIAEKPQQLLSNPPVELARQFKTQQKKTQPTSLAKRLTHIPHMSCLHAHTHSSEPYFFRDSICLHHFGTVESKQTNLPLINVHLSSRFRHRR